MESLQPAPRRDAVEGEEVDEYAVVDVELLKPFLHEEGTALAHLGPIEWGVGLGAELLNEEIFAQECGALGDETLVVLAEHTEVGIIIPGEYVLPKVYPDGCATNAEKLNAEQTAHSVNLFDNLKESLVESVEYFGCVFHRVNRRPTTVDRQFEILKLIIVEYAHKVVGTFGGDYTIEFLAHNRKIEMFALGVVITPIEREDIVAVDVPLKANIATQTGGIVTHGVSIRIAICPIGHHLAGCGVEYQE